MNIEQLVNKWKCDCGQENGSVRSDPTCRNCGKKPRKETGPTTPP